jgi:hypothetical protein
LLGVGLIGRALLGCALASVAARRMVIVFFMLVSFCRISGFLFSQSRRQPRRR